MITTLVLGAVALGDGQPTVDRAVGMRLSGELLVSKLTEDVWQVWRIQPGNGAAEQLTHDGGDKRYPGWMPDGSVYYVTSAQQCFRLAGKGDAPEPVLKEYWPLRDVVISGSDESALFARIRTDLIDATNLWKVRLDGTNPRMLTKEPGLQYMPRFHPDGARIAFVAGDGWGSYEIYTSGPDGNARERLTRNRSHEFLPAWSPDGQRIAFVSDRAGDYDIWVMNADGTAQMPLTTVSGLDTAPAWSPDGKRLAFTSNRQGSIDLWCMRDDGTDQALLAAGARDAAWRASLNPAHDPPPPRISDVSITKKTVVPSEGTTVTFAVSDAAAVTLDIVNDSGTVQRRLSCEVSAAGRQSLHWDGRDEAGTDVASGVYRYVLRAAHSSTGTDESLWDPATSEPWGREVQPIGFTFDKVSGSLRWVMPCAGYVRLRAAVQGFPLLRTLLDWQPREGGAQEHTWDGTAGGGLSQLLEHPQLWITLEIIELPKNALFVEGADRERRTESTPASYAPLVTTGEGVHLAMRKRIDDARAPQCSIELGQAYPTDELGRPIVSGTVPVRVRLADDDLASMTDALFEIAVYVDLTFLFEDEESTSPFTFAWDSSALPAGPHVLTVNAFSYDGRIGTTSRAVVIGDKQ